MKMKLFIAIAIIALFSMKSFSQNDSGVSQSMDGFTHSIMVSWGLGGRSTQRVK